MSRSRIAQLFGLIFVIALSKHALAVGECYRLDASVDLLLREAAQTAHASGSVTCFASNNVENYEGSFTGTMTIHQVNPSIDYNEEFSASGEWIGSLDAPADYSTKTCYQAFISATSGYTSGSGQSAEECTPYPPSDPDRCPPPGSPIVINLQNGDYELTGANDPVLFDIAASGIPRRIGWTAAGAEEAFLWVDRNHNGKVDDGSELFGNATPLQNGQRASNGFTALADLDSNGDGVIDNNDPIWNSLLLWVDRNHDGISQPDEIQPVSASSITVIELFYYWTGRRDQYGNTFRYEGRLRQEHRSKVFYDIFFVTVEDRLTAQGLHTLGPCPY